MEGSISVSEVTPTLNVTQLNARLASQQATQLKRSHRLRRAKSASPRHFGGTPTC